MQNMVSTEFILVLFFSSLMALGVGALMMRKEASRRTSVSLNVAESHSLQLLELQKTIQQGLEKKDAAEKQVTAMGTILGTTRAHVSTLEEQVAAYLRQYAQAKHTLKTEILQKNFVSTELAAAGAQIQALRGRVQELEMEREASHRLPPA